MLKLSIGRRNNGKKEKEKQKEKKE